MGLQNASNGGALLNKIFVTGTFNTNGQVPTYTSGQFNPGSGGGGTWGSITGTLSSQTDLQTALNNKQNTITTGSTSQHFRGDLSLSSFSTDCLAVALTGLTSTAGTISSTDNILAAFGKTLKGLADVNTRVDNLTSPNTGYFNGGENATISRTLGNTTAYSLGIIVNNQERISINSNGVVNVWSGARYAVSNSYMSSGSLTIGNTSANFGGGTNWNTNTAGLLFECLDNTEIAVHDSNTRVMSLFYYAGGSTNTLTIGRDMYWGKYNNLTINTDVEMGSYSGNSIPYTKDVNNRPTLVLSGSYPHIAIVAKVADNNNGASISLGAYNASSTTNFRKWNKLVPGQDAKWQELKYYNGTDPNPSNGSTFYRFWGHNDSGNSNIGNSGSIVLNSQSTPRANLDIQGADDLGNGGSIAWGYKGLRTQLRYNPNLNLLTDGFLNTQSGFYFSNNNASSSNYFPTAFTGSSSVMLIDARSPDGFGNGYDSLQIAANSFDTDLWYRKIRANSGTWYQVLSIEGQTSKSNGWIVGGNNLSSNATNKFGSTSNHDISYISNNIECFKISGSSSLNTSSMPMDFTGTTKEIRMNGNRVLTTRKSGLTAANNTAISATYDSTMQTIIANMRTRINELEDRLASTNGHGLFT